jgi:hypothetical protein
VQRLRCLGELLEPVRTLLVSSRLAIQTAFIIQLMMLACTLDHKRQGGNSVRLMVQYPSHNSEREISFALRVARMLKTIWVGKTSIAQHILVDVRHKTLPDDLVAWIVLSRWAIARAHLGGKDSGGILPGKLVTSPNPNSPFSRPGSRNCRVAAIRAAGFEHTEGA